MPLLDGKYEVVGQRQQEGGPTRFDAIAPDGTPVTVEWFELAAGQEAAFERYRRLLRRLKREGRAAVHDVVSRPGARYVAWERAEGAQRTALEPEVASLLSEHGFAAAAVDVRAGAGGTRIYALAFDGTAMPLLAHGEETTRPEPKPLRGVAERGVLERASSRTLTWGITGLLLLGTALLSVAAFQRRVVDTSIAVPQLTGTDVRDAVAALAGLGLAVEVAATSSEEEAGVVVDVDPPAGTELRPGRRVRLAYALSAGLLEQTTVPAIVGLSSPDEVGPALWDAGLELGSVSRVHAPAPAGIVLAQSPAEGSAAGAGQTVDVLVSAGPATTPTFLPDLVGMSLEDAKAMADVAGIDPGRVVVDEVGSGDVPAGTVVAQSPAANRLVPIEDTTLRLLVRSGTAAPRDPGSAAPDLVGMSLHRATEAANGVGWQVDVRRMATLNLPAGMVVLQSPPPLSASEERSVLLTVNVHPVALRPPPVRASVKEPEARGFTYAWTILPGIGRTTAEVYVRTLQGERELVETRSVQGGEILRGVHVTSEPGPLTFELLLGGVPYGDPLLVP